MVYWKLRTTEELELLSLSPELKTVMCGVSILSVGIPGMQLSVQFFSNCSLGQDFQFFMDRWLCSGHWWASTKCQVPTEDSIQREVFNVPSCGWPQASWAPSLAFSSSLTVGAGENPPYRVQAKGEKLCSTLILSLTLSASANFWSWLCFSVLPLDLVLGPASSLSLTFSPN